MPRTLSLLAVLKKVDAKGIKSLSDPQWNTFLASDTEPNEIQEKIKKLERLERQGFAYDKTGELILEDSNAMIERFRQRTGRAKGRESLKVKKSKIDVASFKKDFLNKKEEPVKPDTTGASDLVKVDQPPDLSKPDPVEEKETEGLKGIRDVLDDILKVLRLDFKGDRKEARDAQKEAAQNKRDKREGKLEGGVKKSLGVIGKAVGAMLEPFKNIWDSILDFIKFTFLGVLFQKTLKWFEDPKNQKKAERIGKFFKDWWPALATAAALWLTPLGALLNGVVGLLTAIIPKLVMAIAANPYAALALVGTGLAVYGISKLAGEKSLPDKAVDESVEEIGREETINELKEEQENRGVMGRVGDFFTGAGAEREQQIERLEGNVEMNGGGLVQSTQNYNEGGLVQSTQNYNEGGLVQHYNDQKSAQNFVQKYNEGGLVQNFQGGGFSNITNTETTSSSNSTGDFSFGVNYVSPEEAKERVAAMGMPSMELMDGTVVPDFGKMGGESLTQGLQLTRDIMVENGASPDRIAKVDELMVMPDAQPDSIANKINQIVPGSMENTMMNVGDSISASVKMNGGGLVNTYNNLTKIKNYKQGGFVSGPGGVDKVPAKLTAGEFVMSKGAVQKFGVNTLASMNAAGGGTNVPTITQEYNQGGLVQYLQGGGEVKKPQGIMRLLAGAADVMTGGLTDFDQRGSILDSVKKLTSKEPVETPVPAAQNRVVTLPTISAGTKQNEQGIIPAKSENDIPQFRVPIISHQRSMVVSTLGIADLMGGA